MKYTIAFDKNTGEVLSVLRSTGDNATITSSPDTIYIRLNPELGEAVRSEPKRYKYINNTIVDSGTVTN